MVYTQRVGEVVQEAADLVRTYIAGGNLEVNLAEVVRVEMCVGE